MLAAMVGQEPQAVENMIEGPLVSISDRQYRVQLQAISTAMTGLTPPTPPAANADSISGKVGIDLVGLETVIDLSSMDWLVGSRMGRWRLRWKPIG